MIDKDRKIIKQKRNNANMYIEFMRKINIKILRFKLNLKLIKSEICRQNVNKAGVKIAFQLKY